MAYDFKHDPDALLDYRWDWSSWLDDGETISDHEIIVPTGMTLSTSSGTTTDVTAWVSGGTPKALVDLTCRITTNQGRTEDRSIGLLVTQR